MYLRKEYEKFKLKVNLAEKIRQVSRSSIICLETVGSNKRKLTLKLNILHNI